MPLHPLGPFPKRNIPILALRVFAGIIDDGLGGLFQRLEHSQNKRQFPGRLQGDVAGVVAPQQTRMPSCPNPWAPLCGRFNQIRQYFAIGQRLCDRIPARPLASVAQRDDSIQNPDFRLKLRPSIAGPLPTLKPKAGYFPRPAFHSVKY